MPVSIPVPITESMACAGSAQQLERASIQIMKKQGQLSNEIKKLQYQLSYSEHINKELSSQLAALCDKMGIVPSKFKQTGDIPLINAQLHLQELYYVEPMLMCYEETIRLLKDELEEATERARDIEQNVMRITNQNAFVRKELESKIQLLTKSENLGFNVNFVNMENKDLKDKIEILNAKINFLARKNQQMTEDFEKVQKENLSLFGKKDIEDLQYRLREEVKKKQAELIQAKSEVEILRNQLSNQQSISKDTERKLSQMESELIRYKNEVKVTRQQLENTQVLQERSKDSLETELQSVKEQLAILQRKEQEMFTRSMSLESELQDRTNKVHNLNVQLSQLQANNNNMLQMLENYEVKVSALNKKLKKAEAELKELADEKLENTKRAEISEWKLAEKVEELERREAEWRKEKARIAKMWEDRLDAVRKTMDSSAPIMRAQP